VVLPLCKSFHSGSRRFTPEVLNECTDVTQDTQKYRRHSFENGNDAETVLCVTSVNAHAPTLTLAIVGAGPVGLALGLMAARQLPQAHITLFDAKDLSVPVAADPRALALSLGSVQILQRLGVWPDVAPNAMLIDAVHVSQQQPALLGFAGEPALRICAQDEGVDCLGAVARYGAIVAPLQAAWLDACEQNPARLQTRFGTKVNAFKALPQGVEIDAGVVDAFDLVVVAEGGVFAQQPHKPVSALYHQTAWVGEVTLEGGTRGVAYERFTPQGPAALLPLPNAPDTPATQHRAALVWCVSDADDPVRALNNDQRQAVLNTVFAPGTGRITAVSTLKSFALGLSAERRVVQGRTVRIGNAAQTLHPVAGQGLNLGLRDAFELCAELARGGPIGLALKTLERRRFLDRWAMIGATDFLARSFIWPLPGLTSLRGLGLAALQMASPLKSKLARHMMFGSR
jgi:2-octaprenyl-6-methoxyphenol hydroxylase